MHKGQDHQLALGEIMSADCRPIISQTPATQPHCQTGHPLSHLADAMSCFSIPPQTQQPEKGLCKAIQNQ
jgi:hypothetical protein